MQVFAVDTCLDSGSVAVRTERGDVWCVPLDPGAGIAETVIQKLMEASREYGISLARTTSVVAVTGPGGFTGQRVGLAVAQAVALASGARCYVLTSLNAIALALLRDRVGRSDQAAGRDAMLVVADAKRGQVYAQTFDGRAVATGAPVCLDVAEAAAFAANFDGVVCGPAAALVAPRGDGERGHSECAFRQTLASDILTAPDRLGLAPVDKIRPLYLRAPDAAPARPVLPRP